MNGNIADCYVPIAYVRPRAKFDGVAVGCGNAICHRHILAETLSRALKADGIVLAVEDTVGNHDILRFYVYTVIIVVAMGIDLNAAYPDAFAISVVLHPVGRILQAHILHQHIPAIPEQDNHGPSGGIGFSRVECWIAPLSIDGSKAGNGYILLTISIYQARMRGFPAIGPYPMRLFVGIDIGDSHKFGSHLQVEFHAGFELDRASQELSCRHSDRSPTLRAQLVDGFLDGGCVVLSGHSLCPGPGYIDIPTI